MKKLKRAASGLVFGALERLNRLKEDGMSSAPKTAATGAVYAFTMKTIDGKDKPLSEYKGKVLLLVNTASMCGFTPQYKSLEELYQRFKPRGLVILGFPANEFGAQEPGSDAQIKEFCLTRFALSFDLFSKIVVKGAGIHPLYQFLTTESGFNGAIPWNFTKFLVSRDGRVAGRFGPNVEPDSAELTKAVEALL